MTIASSFLILIFLTFLTACTVGENYSKKEIYPGKDLKGITYLCKSDRVSSGGFWNDVSKSQIEQGVLVNRESNPSTWRITLNKGSLDADVIRFSGASKAIEEPEKYSIEITSNGGLLLISKNRESGHSPQIITIDPNNSSFVYSSQHVNFLYNRTNIFFGSCDPYI